MTSTTPVADTIGVSVSPGAAAPASPPAIVPRVPGRKRGPRPRYTPEQVAVALERAEGVKADAARQLGCTGQTINNYIAAHAQVRAAWDKFKAPLVDLPN